jgi:hypothetical protein
MNSFYSHWLSHAFKCFYKTILLFSYWANFFLTQRDPLASIKTKFKIYQWHFDIWDCFIKGCWIAICCMVSPMQVGRVMSTLKWSMTNYCFLFVQGLITWASKSKISYTFLYWKWGQCIVGWTKKQLLH